MALVKAESPSSLSTVDSVVPVSSGRLIKPQPASVKVKAKSRKTTTPMNLVGLHSLLNTRHYEADEMPYRAAMPVVYEG